jgi:hypothetical protein
MRWFLANQIVPNNFFAPGNKSTTQTEIAILIFCPLAYCLLPVSKADPPQAEPIFT